MSRTEDLRQSRSVYTVAWREFLLAITAKPAALFCFFEGEDNKYYIGRLRPLLTANTIVKPLVCGGKSGVIRVNELWGEKYSNATKPPKCMFFVDRDFDSRSSLQMKGMAYITPCYSVENLFLSRQCVGAILENEFGVHTEESLDQCAALQYFEDLMMQFLEASTLLNAWIFLHRKYEALNPADKKLNLKNVKFHQLFSVTENGVAPLYNESSLPLLFPDARGIDADELRRYAHWFASFDGRRVFRGKYLVEFLRKVLEIIKADRVSVTPRLFPKKFPVKLGLSRENIVSELCQYADTPACLATFIRKLDSGALLDV